MTPVRSIDEGCRGVIGYDKMSASYILRETGPTREHLEDYQTATNNSGKKILFQKSMTVQIQK